MGSVKQMQRVEKKEKKHGKKYQSIGKKQI